MLKELTDWDFPDVIQIPDGYNMRGVPETTRRNFEILVVEHNKVVAAINVINEKLGIKDENRDNSN